MRAYNGLLESIAAQLGILKGDTESDINFKCRIIYSALGKIAYASLRDIQEDGNPASITHFKRRIEKTLSSYADMYPEIRSAMLYNCEALSDEIYRNFLGTGFIYHTPNRLVPAKPSAAAADDIILMRGMATDFPCNISGLGSYGVSVEPDTPICSINDMFQIPSQTLSFQFSSLLKKCVWSELKTELYTEYLRAEPPFKYGYWMNIPDKSGNVYLLRTGQPGTYIYYLYKYENRKILISQLPMWLVEGHNYHRVSNCCLASAGCLPEISYRCDGCVVYIDLNYLLPAEELNLLRLYSWPLSYTNFPSDFHRIMDLRVFNSLKSVFEEEGFEFTEVKEYVRC